MNDNEQERRSHSIDWLTDDYVSSRSDGPDTSVSRHSVGHDAMKWPVFDALVVFYGAYVWMMIQLRSTRNHVPSRPFIHMLYNNERERERTLQSIQKTQTHERKNVHDESREPAQSLSEKSIANFRKICFGSLRYVGALTTASSSSSEASER